MLINIFEAMELAKKHLSKTEPQARVFIDYIETRVYGWVFGWNVLEYIETGLNDYLSFGNVPLLVTKKGEIFGCNKRYIKEFLKEWEAERGLGYLYPQDHGLQHLYPDDEFPFIEGAVDEETLGEARKEYLRQLDR